MDAPHTRTTSAWHLWLFNPFHFLAGGQALAWGLACIVLTAWLGGIFDFPLHRRDLLPAHGPGPALARYSAGPHGLGHPQCPALHRRSPDQSQPRAPHRRLRHPSPSPGSRTAHSPDRGVAALSRPHRVFGHPRHLASLHRANRPPQFGRYGADTAAGLDGTTDVPRLCRFVQCRRWSGHCRIHRRHCPR